MATSESSLFLFSSLFAIHLLQLEPLFVSRLLSVAEWKETLTKLEATAHSRPEVVTAHRHHIGGRLWCLRRLVVHNACPARWNVTRLINVHHHSCELGSQFWRSIVLQTTNGEDGEPYLPASAELDHHIVRAHRSNHSLNLQWKATTQYISWRTEKWIPIPQSRTRRVFTVYEILHANLLHVYTSRSSCRRTCKHEIGLEPSGRGMVHSCHDMDRVLT